ncbi:DUF6538 domain-containing protein [Rhodopseudomonas palustris]|uniref:DUF6538 domain-containing protein n=1 Tax=Rhodopseudomonas palustris TaxID=1076 RepID=UPI00163D3DE8|nr:DUF6538 domain-containing protein [Rhodopseudomonas palustris]
MSRPIRHSSGIYWYRKRVPKALRSLVGKLEEKISLRTRDPAEAKIAHARVSAEVEERWHRLRQGTQSLSHRQAEAIAGEIYRSLMDEHHDDPQNASIGPLLIDQAFHGKAKMAFAGKDQKATAALIEKLRTSRNAKRIEGWLSAHGYILTLESRELVGKAVDKAVLQAREQLHRMRDGDYRPDPNEGRFPPLEIQTASVAPAGDFHLLKVFDRYASEANLGAGTIKKWRPIMAKIADEVPDIRNLTRTWCIAWKDRQVARGIAMKSVRETYIASIKAVCEWAISNGILDENPALRIKVKVPKETGKRGYTEGEATLILRASLIPMSDRAGAEHRAARRWIPSLCAYTGARVGEMAQLRKQDVRKVDGVWMLRITPDAGTVKGGGEREIAIHPELVRQGFVDFVLKSSGPLFCAKKSPRKGSDQNPTFRKVGERIAAWVRQEVGIKDKNISPNHAWRHRFRTIAEEVDMRESILDYVLGHAPATVGRKYGERKPQSQYREISKIPVIDIGAGKNPGHWLTKKPKAPAIVTPAGERKPARRNMVASSM